jgi:hypothetical protein
MDIYLIKETGVKVAKAYGKYRLDAWTTTYTYIFRIM